MTLSGLDFVTESLFVLLQLGLSEGSNCLALRTHLWGSLTQAAVS